MIALNALFAANQVRKEYLAVTIGEMSEKGVVINPIEGKSSKSEFEVMSSIASDRFGQLNLVKLIPHTGRRHQLRKHMAEIGNPILGDKEYGKSGLILTGKGLYLHSKMLEFTHPVSNETVRVESLAPAKFLKLFP